MSAFSAIVPVDHMDAANLALGDAGYGYTNFSVPAYAGAAPTHALFHCWHAPEFQAACEALPNVTINLAEVPPQGDVPGYTTEPIATTDAVVQAVGAKWGATAPLLTGSVTPGLYRNSTGLWWVIQAYNTAVYPDPTVIPALIRRARVPGERAPWVQPLDQFNAYKLVNAFTGKPDECTHNGAAWKVTQADGAGNNVWAPGVFGWTQV